MHVFFICLTFAYVVIALGVATVQLREFDHHMTRASFSDKKASNAHLAYAKKYSRGAGICFLSIVVVVICLIVYLA